MVQVIKTETDEDGGEIPLYMNLYTFLISRYIGVRVKSL